MPDLLLSPNELAELTNGLTQPAAQLRALHSMGYTRAHRPRNGPVVLARAHFLAVEEQRAAAAQEQNQAAAAAGASVVVALQGWASKRKAGSGQKAQGR